MMMWVDLSPDKTCLILTAQAMDDEDWSQLYLKITLLQVSRNQTRKSISQIFIFCPPGRWQGCPHLGEEAESEEVQKSQFQADRTPDHQC